MKRKDLIKIIEQHGCIFIRHEGKHDILRNQLAFVNAGMSFKTYADLMNLLTVIPLPLINSS